MSTTNGVVGTIVTSIEQSTTENITADAIDAWSSIEQYFELTMWIFGSASALLFTLSALCILLDAFKVRRRLFGIRSMIFVVAINRRESTYSLPAVALIKIRNQQQQGGVSSSKIVKSSAVDGAAIGRDKKSAFPIVTLTTSVASKKAAGVNKGTACEKQLQSAIGSKSVAPQKSRESTPAKESASKITAPATTKEDSASKIATMKRT